MSAIGEWLLSIGWVGYLSTVAFDLYHIRATVQVFRSYQSVSVCDPSSERGGFGSEGTLNDIGCKSGASLRFKRAHYDRASASALSMVFQEYITTEQAAVIQGEPDHSRNIVRQSK